MDREKVEQEEGVFRDSDGIPLYLSTSETLAEDLREAEEARKKGGPFVPAEEVLAKMEQAIREVKEQVREDKENDIPPSPYLSTPETLADDLREAEEARLNGVPFVPAEEVLAKMERTIREVKERGA